MKLRLAARRFVPRLLATIAIASLGASPAWAAVCDKEDFETRVSGVSECLLMRRYGTEEPAAMVVWLHGNLTSGNPASYQFAIAQKAATDLAADRVLSVAVVRPGYPDGSGGSSSGNDYGRGDNWNRANILEVAEAIERLRSRFRPDRLIVAGHSGGAAIAAVLLGMRPQLAQAAVLVACPCDTVAWRTGRSRGQWLSENPIDWIDRVERAVKVIALTGSQDLTTPSGLAQGYAERLATRGVDARFEAIPDEGHNNAFGSAAVARAVASLISAQ